MDGDDIYDELLDAALHRAFLDFRDRAPIAWRQAVSDAVSSADSEASAHERLGISEQLLNEILSNPPFTRE